MTDDAATPNPDDDLATVRRILTSARTATVTSRAASGALHSRPLALLEHGVDGTENFAGSLWFFTADPSEKTDEIRRHPEVNVSVADGKGHLSLSGRASIDRSQARIDLLWNPWAEAYFEGGREDPAVALLRVDVDSIEFWDLDRPALRRVVEVAAALIAHRPPEIGESRTVEL
ncbi:pyridoxamine 5'-phosphate oxidase family protein [Schumannella sp. 10F1B-5-1]|uniref:pyridoxamine 5'-phosphate oxidase family protein n=1 Tax=Schumannella sp. 10F1B-5-1 TaxID=2590780 RepID=UPI001131828F|nr:pyridoxamine 5'-phosphate oxidase family protein [Schumannella sp. 10F1B-5-1]TPW70064.1 general stress protein [Schumannella sp. 10F1B-5-1]